MSVRTTADELIDSAKDQISAAYQKLLQALDSDTWGSSEYNSDYVDKLHEAALTLLKAKRLL